jgi:hypothetical protein
LWPLNGYWAEDGAAIFEQIRPYDPAGAGRANLAFFKVPSRWQSIGISRFKEFCYLCMSGTEESRYFSHESSIRYSFVLQLFSASEL